jgi:hypothetical protein
MWNSTSYTRTQASRCRNAVTFASTRRNYPSIQCNCNACNVPRTKVLHKRAIFFTLIVGLAGTQTSYTDCAIHYNFLSRFRSIWSLWKTHAALRVSLRVSGHEFFRQPIQVPKIESITAWIVASLAMSMPNSAANRPSGLRLMDL